MSDKEYGFLDLAPYYYDGSTASNPTAGLPREINPSRGWVNGRRAEYYDFGLINSVKLRTSSSTPDYAVVPPMYFFFDEAGNPLFSKPIWEARTAAWHMRGGLDVLNPNPRNDANKQVVYSVRTRDLLIDQARGTADYQRPIVDKIQHNSEYTGLWEIVEITVGANYQPDAVKSYATLKKGIDSGAFLERRTHKVINCPVVDDRTYIVPSAMYYGIPRPQIEIWYRTKRGRCFLADGWLTLGEPNGNLYKAGQDNRRVQTFDIIAYTIGGEGTERTTVVAPFSKLFVPTVRVANQDPARSAVDIRYINDNLSEALPKRGHGDAPGYRPLRWLWDLRVPQDPPYEAGTYKTMESMDPASIASRGAWTRNFPLIGVAQPCASDDDCANLRVGPNTPPLTCNLKPNLDIYANELPPPTPTRATAPSYDTLALQREGGPRCDLPVVRYGEFCAPGVARCQFDRDPTPPTSNGNTLFAVPMTMDSPAIPLGEAGSTLIGGYTCQPMNTGYCYFRCDVDAGGTTRKEMKVPVDYGGPAGQKLRTEIPTLESDPRCGFLRGYRCLNPATTPSNPVIPTKNRVCLRQCATSNPDAMNDQFCGAASGANPFPLSVGFNGGPEADITKGQKCSNRGISGVAGCQWDPAYEPRDPRTNYGAK